MNRYSSLKKQNDIVEVTEVIEVMVDKVQAEMGNFISPQHMHDMMNKIHKEIKGSEGPHEPMWMGGRDFLEKENDIIRGIVDEVQTEMKRAVGVHGPMRGPHEGYAVLLEEVDEVWDLVKGYPKRATRSDMRKEMIQVAAMAVRFIYDVCDYPK